MNGKHQLGPPVEDRIRVPFFSVVYLGEPSPKKETVKGQHWGN